MCVQLCTTVCIAVLTTMMHSCVQPIVSCDLFCIVGHPKIALCTVYTLEIYENIYSAIYQVIMLCGVRSKRYIMNELSTLRVIIFMRRIKVNPPMEEGFLVGKICHMDSEV